MTGMTLAVNDAVLSSYDFSSISTIVDVGGGHGSLIASILKANPQMKGVLFDAPSVAEGAQSRIEVEGIADRCEVVAGDFFQLGDDGAQGRSTAGADIHDPAVRMRAVQQPCVDGRLLNAPPLAKRAVARACSGRLRNLASCRCSR